MSYKIKMLYSPVYELLLSFSLFKRQTHLKYLDIGSQWKYDVEKLISKELLSKIKEKNDLHFEDLSVILIAQCPDKDSIQGFFKWIESLSIGEIYELISPFLSDKVTVPSNLESQRNQFVELLKEWNEQYFQTIDRECLKSLKDEAESTEKRLENESTEEVIRSVSRFVIESDEIKEVYLVPAIHFQPMSLVDQFKDTLFITYPTGKNVNGTERVLSEFKALSDERRINILRYIAETPSTFTSIVKEIGMAKGNIHHHLSVLRGARLLDIHLTNDKNTFYYRTHKNLSSEIKTNLDLLLQ
ncbi:ArsR/SmtB family transcription factor [Pontibacillus marinus]|uniref:HTH arsR-type domain-containing protein n=1 Tax=Pontibacillus marinus BH030004 = DSM 16465 TaxID=1385511 RepID=A0A0A5FXA8_9BACI|nr:winged helix-turn-helix domain-containing protein [Pontibacillus marinus]KGX83405.1 hypothetical protein N783_03830 [Pontibacillus marinus BH030004 = DSM 16465]